MTVVRDLSSQTILLVEDEASDAALIQRALTKGGVSNPVDVVHDGQNALDYLFRTGTYAVNDAQPLPCLVLLDLKLPKVSGLEVVRQVKAAELLKRVPIVVLTSSAQAEDRRRAYDNGVNSYLVKPAELRLFEELAIQIRQYWLEWNTLADARA